MRTSAIDSDALRSPKLWYLKLNRLFRSLSDEDLYRWVDRITLDERPATPAARPRAHEA